MSNKFPQENQELFFGPNRSKTSENNINLAFHEDESFYNNTEHDKTAQDITNTFNLIGWRYSETKNDSFDLIFDE
jgi:hypothetical protein